MRQALKLFILFGLIISCTSNTIYKKPSDLIEKELMIQLIVDMEIATSSGGSSNLRKESGRDYMSLVYEKYEIDSARFERSNFYYYTKIDDYKKILREVERRLKMMEEEQAGVNGIADSIKKEEERRISPRSNTGKDYLKSLLKKK
ncbi:MAG: DUF4296 domain-containing protein [Flavobacteriaceae bacterium]|nr:DUF4296 domain-containing protein [Flavobacteriaceae bacterium]